MATTTVANALTESFVIEGGHPLSGTVRAAGNKNGALPILAACLLTDQTIRLTNVPRIRDVDTMVALLADVGADVEWIGAERDSRHGCQRAQAGAGRGAVQPDARLVPARGAAALAPRLGQRSAARR